MTADIKPLIWNAVAAYVNGADDPLARNVWVATDDTTTTETSLYFTARLCAQPVINIKRARTEKTVARIAPIPDAPPHLVTAGQMIAAAANEDDALLLDYVWMAGRLDHDERAKVLLDLVGFAANQVMQGGDFARHEGEPA